MKKVWLVIFVLVLVVVAYMLWQSKTNECEISDVDTTEAINQDLNSLNTADLNMEFKDIDADLNTL